MFNPISTVLGKLYSPSRRAPRPATSIFSLVPAGNRSKQWESWEINILLDSIETNQHVSVIPQNSDRTLQSVIVGFDLASSTMLLDTIYPCSNIELNGFIKHQTPLVVSVRSTAAGEKFYYNLAVRIVEAYPGPDGFAVTVHVQGVDISFRRRRDSRVHFDQAMRPRVDLTADDVAVKGRLCNLSQYGCLVEVLGDDISRKTQNQTIALNIPFNPQFDVNIEGFVVQARFAKRPNYHNLLHIQFSGTESEAREQIGEFVSSVVALSRRQPERHVA